MPTTPFIGISVLIHILIIIFHKVFKIEEREPEPPSSITKRQYFFSILIVTLMSAIMLSTAVGLLTASVTERHSTVYIVEDTVAWLATQTFDTEVMASVVEAYNPQILALGGVILLFIIAALSVSYVRFPRTTVAASQGGYSLVQVSLFISGMVSILVGVVYAVIYFLLQKS